MPLVTVPGMFLPAHFYGPTASAPSFTSQALGASDKYGMVFQAPKTGNIRKISFRTGTVGTAQDTDARIETVDPATGFPSGTLKTVNSNATIAAASITANAWVTSPAFTADAAVTVGDLIAAVLVPTSTPNYQVNGFTVGTSGFRVPYPVYDSGTGYTKPTDHIPGIGVEYDDGSYYFIPNTVPILTITAHTTFNTGSTPDEIGMKFKMLAPCRVNGIWIWADTDGDFDVVIYDSDGTTVLSTTSFDKDNRQGTGSGHHFLLLDTPVELLADTYYRVTILPSSATNLGIYSITVGSAAILDQLAGGQYFHFTSRTNAGAWTDVTTQRPLLGLMIDQISNGVSSSPVARSTIIQTGTQ